MLGAQTCTYALPIKLGQFLRNYKSHMKFYVSLFCSIFQGLPGGDHVGVVDTISTNIAAVFGESHSTFEFNHGDHSLAFMRRIDYLDVLMENFDLGELALKRQLPVGNVSATRAIFSITLPTSLLQC